MRRAYSTGYSWLLASEMDLPGASRRARSVARSLGWSARDTAALALLVLELGSNAIRHGQGGVCRLEAGPEGADVIVEDHGRGFPVWALAGALERHRGLRAVRQLSEHLVLENVPGGGARARASFRAKRADRDLRPLAAAS